MNKAITGVKTHGLGRDRLGKSRVMVELVGWFAVVAVVVGFAGCSDEGGSKVSVVPVKGSVTFEGEPAAGAFLTFHSKSPAKPGESLARPTATAGSDGTFSLTTVTKDDGAPAGDYTVTVQWTKPIKQGADLVAGPNVIPSKYGQAATSPLQATVGESAVELEPFKITKK